MFSTLEHKPLIFFFSLDTEKQSPVHICILFPSFLVGDKLNILIKYHCNILIIGGIKLTILISYIKNMAYHFYERLVMRVQVGKTVFRETFYFIISFE